MSATDRGWGNLSQGRKDWNQRSWRSTWPNIFGWYLNRAVERLTPFSPGVSFNSLGVKGDSGQRLKKTWSSSWVAGVGGMGPQELPPSLASPRPLSSDGPASFPCLSLAPSHPFLSSLPLPRSAPEVYMLIVIKSYLGLCYEIWHIFISGCMTIFRAALDNAALKNNPTSILILQSVSYISVVLAPYSLELWVRLFIVHIT